MGDKRRRGGKRGARAAEENAHRSSRCRHLSPNLPVSTGSGDYGEGRDLRVHEWQCVFSIRVTPGSMSLSYRRLAVGSMIGSLVYRLIFCTEFFPLEWAVFVHVGPTT